MQVAKKRARAAKKGARAVPSLFTPAPIDVGRTVEVPIKRRQDAEAVFTLTDGTKVYVQIGAASFLRSLDKFNAMGEPIYLINAGLQLRTVIPTRLKRKVSQ